MSNYACNVIMLQTGLTPLHLTAQEERVNAAEVLSKHDANLDQQTKVQTQLLPCVLEEHRDLHTKKGYMQYQ